MSTFAELRNRFDQLAHQTRRVLRVGEYAPKPEPSADEIIAGNVAAWCAHNDCRDHFMPWLEAQVIAAHRRVFDVRASHQDVNYVLGYEAALQNLLDRVRLWSELGRMHD